MDGASALYKTLTLANHEQHEQVELNSGLTMEHTVNDGTTSWGVVSIRAVLILRYVDSLPYNWSAQRHL